MDNLLSFYLNNKLSIFLSKSTNNYLANNQVIIKTYFHYIGYLKLTRNKNLFIYTIVEIFTLYLRAV